MDYLEDEQLVQHIPQLNAHLKRDIIDLTIYNQNDGNISEILLGIHWSQEWTSYVISHNDNFFLLPILKAHMDNFNLVDIMQKITVHYSAFVIHDINFIEGHEVNNMISPLRYSMSDIKNAKIDIYSDNFPFNIEEQEQPRELEQEHGYFGVQQTG